MPTHIVEEYNNQHKGTTNAIPVTLDTRSLGEDNPETSSDINQTGANVETLVQPQTQVPIQSSPTIVHTVNNQPPAHQQQTLPSSFSPPNTQQQQQQQQQQQPQQAQQPQQDQPVDVDQNQQHQSQDQSQDQSSAMEGLSEKLKALNELTSPSQNKQPIVYTQPHSQQPDQTAISPPNPQPQYRPQYQQPIPQYQQPLPQQQYQQYQQYQQQQYQQQPNGGLYPSLYPNSGYGLDPYTDGLLKAVDLKYQDINNFVNSPPSTDNFMTNGAQGETVVNAEALMSQTAINGKTTAFNHFRLNDIQQQQQQQQQQVAALFSSLQQAVEVLNIMAGAKSNTR